MKTLKLIAISLFVLNNVNVYGSSEDYIIVRKTRDFDNPSSSEPLELINGGDSTMTPRVMKEVDKIWASFRGFNIQTPPLVRLDLGEDEIQRYSVDAKIFLNGTKEAVANITPRFGASLSDKEVMDNIVARWDVTQSRLFALGFKKVSYSIKN